MSRNISVIGLGHVGLCTAVCLADRPNKVKAFEIDESKMKLIGEGVSPFYEPQLEMLLRKTIREGNLQVISGIEKAILGSDISFVTVGTPILPDGKLDTSFIRACGEQIGKALQKKESFHLIVVKSTVVPGSTERVVKPILERHSGKKAGTDFGLVFNPEFLREGSAIHDILHPSRIIIGEYDEHSGETLETFYEEFHRERIQVLRTNLATAEMIKYASNALLATKISFINEMANICERLSERVDVVEVAQAIGMDPRIGPHFLQAGLGWGGSCFPKDITALITFSEKMGYNPRILEAVVLVNLEQTKRAVDIVKEEMGNLKGKKISILGLSFKPNTDDVRNAPSLRIIERLIHEGAEVCVYDPAALNNTRRVFGTKIKYFPSLAECIDNADSCILVTEWEEFKKLSPEDYIRSMRNPFLFDGRRIYKADEFSARIKFLAVGLSKMRSKT